MAGSEWFYVRNNERFGPIGIEQMRELLARGEVRPQAHVWTAGMSQWMPAAQVPALSVSANVSTSAATSAAHPGTAAPQPAEPIGYYATAAGMPSRALDNLKGHAAPTGDTGDWPLDDARVSQFADAVKIRKKVTGAAQLYRALLFLSIIGLVIIGIVFLATMGASRGGAGAGVAALGMGMTFVFLIGLTALYYFTWRATMRSQRWAPLTMMIIFLLGVGVNLLSLVVALGARGDPAALIGAVVGIGLGTLFAVVSAQSFVAIPKYRAQPAWCQELIVKAGL